MSFLPAPGPTHLADLPLGVGLGEAASDKKVPPACPAEPGSLEGKRPELGGHQGGKCWLLRVPGSKGALPEALGLAEGGRQVGGEQAAMGVAGGHCSYLRSEYSGVKVPEKATDWYSWST